VHANLALELVRAARGAPAQTALGRGQAFFFESDNAKLPNFGFGALLKNKARSQNAGVAPAIVAACLSKSALDELRMSA
jgi:hypothetical protein